MIVPLQELVITFSLLIVTLIVFFFTGAVFQFFFRSHKKRSGSFSLSPETVFWNSLFGFLLLTSCYAIAITKFQTCLLPVPLLLIALARYCRLSEKEIKAVASGDQNAINRKQILFFSFVSICAYWLFYLFGFISFDPSTIKYIGNDTNFYGRVAHHLNYSGIENTSLDYLGLSKQDPEPYHYGDLWLIALLQKATGLHATVLATLVIYPLLALLFVTGIFICAREWMIDLKMRWYVLPVIIASPFLNGVLFLFPSIFYTTPDFTSVSLVSNSKLFIVAIFLLAILYSLSVSNWPLFLITTTITCLVYTPAAPALFLFTVIVTVQYLYKKEIALRTIILPIAVSFFCAGYLYFFYSRSNNASDYSGINPFSLNPKTSFNILIGGLFQLVPLLPFALLSYFAHQSIISGTKPDLKKLKKILWFLFSLFIAALICWFLLNTLSTESYQFFKNMALPVFSIFITLSLLMGLAAAKKIIPAVFFLFLLAIGFNIQHPFSINTVSRNDLNKVSVLLKQNMNGIFVTFKSMKEHSSYFAANTEFTTALPYLDYRLPLYNPVSFNTPYLLREKAINYKPEELRMQNNTAFDRYIKLHGLTDTIAGMQSFITRYNVRYFCVSPDTTLPLLIRPRITDSVVLDNKWIIYKLSSNH